MMAESGFQASQSGARSQAVACCAASDTKLNLHEAWFPVHSIMKGKAGQCPRLAETVLARPLLLFHRGSASPWLHTGGVYTRVPGTQPEGRTSSVRSATWASGLLSVPGKSMVHAEALL